MPNAKFSRGTRGIEGTGGTASRVFRLLPLIPRVPREADYFLGGDYVNVIARRAFLQGRGGRPRALARRAGRVAAAGPGHHARGRSSTGSATTTSCEFDPTGRYVLGMEVDFEHRSPKADDVIQVGMVDLQDERPLDRAGRRARAWCWQQGCMLQWLPGSKTEVLWNDREGDRFVCRILDVKTRQAADASRARSTPSAPTASGPSPPTSAGSTTSGPATATPASPTRTQDELAPEGRRHLADRSGTGKQKLILSFADVAAVRRPRPGDMEGGQALVQPPAVTTPDGSRFVFLHRWRGREGKAGASRTRMFTADAGRQGPARRSTRTGGRRTSSGATRSTSWPGRSTQSHGERLLPVRGPRPTRSRSSART